MEKYGSSLQYYDMICAFLVHDEKVICQAFLQVILLAKVVRADL